MSENQLTCGEVKCACYQGASKFEGPSIFSHDDSNCTRIERLPSWREFTEGVPSISQYRGYCISMSLKGSNYKRYPLVPLEFRNPLFRTQSHFSSPPSALTQEVLPNFNLLTPGVSSRNVSALALVDHTEPTAVPQKLRPSYKNSKRCNICGHSIVRDLARHLRTHNKEARFKCFYPSAGCPHKSGYFHRKYDFKKHLLHRHFVLRDSKVKSLNNLTDKLEHEGTCPCGQRMKAREWLIHIIARNPDGRPQCEDLKKKMAENKEDNKESWIGLDRGS